MASVGWMELTANCGGLTPNSDVAI